MSAGTAQDVSLPGNVWLYCVPSGPGQLQTQPPTRVGGVSLTSSATQAGLPLRITMKDSYLYAFTFLQGLQVVDLNQVVSEYQQASPADFGTAMSTAGEGFATDAVINTIPLPLASGGQGGWRIHARVLRRPLAVLKISHNTLATPPT
ncbi:MAG: hypothetical protein ACRD5K_12850 [Candidatus Acidiferrales bacterium]